MKKFFSLIALVGVIAACTPEKIETAFKLAGAKVTVIVDVRDIINGGAYTGSYEVSCPIGTKTADNTYVIQADESQAITSANYEIKVTGPKLAKEYSSNFAVPSVLAGGEAVIRVVVPVGEPWNGYALDVIEGDATRRTVINYLVNEAYEKYEYSHSGLDFWYYNNTEYRIPAHVDYYMEDDAYILAPLDNNILGFEGRVQSVMDEYTAGYEWNGDDYELDFEVSAYAMWNVLQTVSHLVLPVTVKAQKGTETPIELGSFSVDYVNYSVAEPIELPYPLAPGHAHYHQGHGHDAHGSMPNAGGGMSDNE